MLKFYLVSIAIYWLSFLEFRIRRAINKEKIIIEETSINHLKILRLIAISFTPIFNLMVGIIGMYASICMPQDKYIDLMNEK